MLDFRRGSSLIQLSLEWCCDSRAMPDWKRKTPFCKEGCQEAGHGIVVGIAGWTRLLRTTQYIFECLTLFRERSWTPNFSSFFSSSDSSHLLQFVFNGFSSRFLLASTSNIMEFRTTRSATAPLSQTRDQIHSIIMNCKDFAFFQRYWGTCVQFLFHDDSNR